MPSSVISPMTCAASILLALGFSLKKSRTFFWVADSSFWVVSSLFWVVFSSFWDSPPYNRPKPVCRLTFYENYNILGYLFLRSELTFKLHSRSLTAQTYLPKLVFSHSKINLYIFLASNITYSTTLSKSFNLANKNTLLSFPQYFIGMFLILNFSFCNSASISQGFLIRIMK